MWCKKSSLILGKTNGDWPDQGVKMRSIPISFIKLFSSGFLKYIIDWYDRYRDVFLFFWALEFFIFFYRIIIAMKKKLYGGRQRGKKQTQKMDNKKPFTLALLYNNIFLFFSIPSKRWVIFGAILMMVMAIRVAATATGAASWIGGWIGRVRWILTVIRIARKRVRCSSRARSCVKRVGRSWRTETVFRRTLIY